MAKDVMINPIFFALCLCAVRVKSIVCMYAALQGTVLVQNSCGE